MRAIRADDEDALAQATSALDAGELVVVPGDLRYLVAADALDDAACERLFAATQRAADRPLAVVVSGYADVHHVAYGGPSVRELTDARWPGPTMVELRARPWMPDVVTAGQGTLRVVAPAHPFTNALARHFGPLAVAGARVRGQPDALDAGSAMERLGNAVALYVDGGTRAGGDEALLSTQQG